MHYILFYNYVEDIVERRAPFRESHLGLLQEYQVRDELVLAGAYADPVDGAAFIFNVKNQDDIERFVNNDPYVSNGLVTQWYIRKWSTAVGSALNL